MRYAEWGLCLFAGCVIGWWWGERPDALREFLSLDVMTAFGTIGAVIVALWATRTETRRIGRAQKDRSALYAAYIAPKIERYVEALNVAALLTHFDDLDGGTPKFDRFRLELESAIGDVPLDLVAELAPLDRRAGQRLARGMAIVEEVRRDVEAETKRQRENPGRYYPSDEVALGLGLRLSEAVDMLRVALSVCQDLADKYAASPTPDELYGD